MTDTVAGIALPALLQIRKTEETLVNQQTQELCVLWGHIKIKLFWGKKGRLSFHGDVNMYSQYKREAKSQWWKMMKYSNLEIWASILRKDIDLTTAIGGSTQPWTAVAETSARDVLHFLETCTLATSDLSGKHLVIKYERATVLN